MITNDKIFIKIIYFDKFVFAVTDALPSYSLMSLIISEPGRAGDKPCQCIVAKPDLLVVEPKELTTEYKRTVQPTQVNNRLNETGIVLQ